MWLRHAATRGDCLTISYEQMRADASAGFQRLLDFGGDKSVSGAALAALSSIENMRAAERAGHALGGAGATLRKPSLDGQSAKVRRAVVGAYVDKLRPETIAKCHQIAAQFGLDA